MSGQTDESNLDTPGPSTGLTPRERQIVVDTWGVVKRNAKEAGVEMFTRLFEAHPQYQKLFPNFEGLTLSVLRTSKKLAAHATNVMYSLTSVVDNLDDPECLKELLIKLGKNHGRHKVYEKQFHDLELVLMELLKEKLGNQLTPQGEVAWKKTIDIVYKGIFQGMRAYDASSVK